MIGFKGLIPKSLVTIPTIQLIAKKLEQNRKTAQFCIDLFLQITKFQQWHAKNNSSVFEQSKSLQIKSDFNKRLHQCISEIVSQQNVLCNNFHKCIQLVVKGFNQNFAKASTCITKLQQCLEDYREQEENAFEISKKYYKHHKNLLSALQLYKNSFTDVNLIYNLDEKIKRYQNCNNLYHSATVEYTLINNICDSLWQKKKELSICYEQVEAGSKLTMKMLGLILVENSKQFIQFYQQFSFDCIDVLHLFASESEKCSSLHLFQDEFDVSKLLCYKDTDKINVQKQFPIIIQYHSLLKDQYLQCYNIQIQAYFQIVNSRLEHRKYQNKRIQQIFLFYFKALQKVQSMSKQILINFEKKRKKIFQCFGNRLISFLKSVSSVFQIYASISQKIFKSTHHLFQTIHNLLAQDLKLINLFKEQTKSNLIRFIIKKQLNKKTMAEHEDQNTNTNIRLIRKQMNQKAQFAKHMISGFQQKFCKNTQKIKIAYCQIMKIYKQFVAELSQFSAQYFQLYFGANQFVANLQKYNADIQCTLVNNCKFYHEPPLNLIVADLSKVLFQGEFSKIDDFRKLKKPILVDSKILQKSFEQPIDFKQTKNSSSEKIIEDEKQIKNALFLMTKISFKQKQRLIKTFSCALVEKIMLQGKVYITNERVCFHSNFNSQNIFFGKTFIQFPKSDIKKIQKKLNSLIDNSISFTTYNGQIVFTSFFSRNQAYDLICKSLQFNLDEHVYEYEQNCIEQELPEFLINCEQKDDIKLSQIESRKQIIDKLIQNPPYIQATKIQIIQEGLNSLKVFKILYTQQDIAIGRKKYADFLRYMKQKLDQKYIEVGEWVPNLNTILNQSNIKQTSPVCVVRKIRSIVPLTNTGVPFMPKTAKAEQTQNLYFYSKHKFILDGIIESRGAPYTDTFEVHLRTIVESDQDGKCSIGFYYYVNFVKPTMMKSVIQSKSKEETASSCRIWATQIQNYFHELVKKSKKKYNQSLDLNQFNETEIQSVIQHKNMNQTQIGSSQKQFQYNLQIWKSIAIASIIINLIMVYIYII